MTISLIPTLACISNTIDMINPRLNLHHVRTAFIAWHLAKIVHFSPAQCRKTVLAALLHDIGGLNEQSRLEPLNYIDDEQNNHALIGGELLSLIPLFKPLKEIVRYHHTRWENGLGRYIDGEHVPEESHLLYFADRVDVLLTQYRNENISSLREVLTETICNGANVLYKEEFIHAFEKLAARDYFWSAMQSSRYEDYIKEIPRIHNDNISLHNLRDIADLLAFIVDQFSRHPPWYSLTVGRIAGFLARAMGLDPTQSLKVEIGGLLHNIGCLDHSPTDERRAIADDEADKTWRALHPIEGIRDIAGWCVQQHRLYLGAASDMQISPEACIIAASHRLARMLEVTDDEGKFRMQLKATEPPDEISQAVHRLAAQHSKQLIQLWRSTIQERQGFVKRLEQLDVAFQRENVNPSE
ncbi:HD domain-containing protein [Entomohabitans teleogrylli]|uniref:HD domain-containing protein n=1 Tax=Entomohabitans teleogrylli TaxID=1384589 RepID=UPI00073D234E|nr:HD domain-containing protein [Entomohabitans teleogrylli]